MKTKFNRILSMLLVCMMVLTSPLSILAAEFGDGTEQPSAVETQADAFTDSGEAFDAAEGSAETPELFSDEPQAEKAADGRTIDVSFTLLGDEVHGEPKDDDQCHTYSKGNLTEWISETVYTVPADAKVVDVIHKALAEHEMTCEDAGGTYVSAVTKDGKTLAAFGNGNGSGWMYLYNGALSNLGIGQQRLKNNDKITMFYTDDFVSENKIPWDEIPFQVSLAEYLVIDLPEADALTLDDAEDVAAARAAYAELLEEQKVYYDDSLLTKLEAAEKKIAELKGEGEEKPDELVEQVKEMLRNLPSPDEFTLENRFEYYEMTKAAELLTIEQFDQLGQELGTKLNDLFDKYTALAEKHAEDIAAADKVGEMFHALPNPEDITLENKQAIEDACKALDNLTDYQQKIFEFAMGVKRNELTWHLMVLEKIEEVNALVDALPEIENLTLEDEESVKALRTAYEELVKVDSENYYPEKAKEILNVLVAAEAQIELLKQGGTEEPEGSGTQDDPYVIKKASDLPENIEAGEYYVLDSDIELTENQKIETIAGSLDGRGHVITLWNQALADSIKGTSGNQAIVRNLGLEAANQITDRGSFANSINDGIIQNCYAGQSIAFEKISVGGLVGGNPMGGTFQNVYFAGTLPNFSGAIANSNKSFSWMNTYSHCYYTNGTAFDMTFRDEPGQYEKKTVEELKENGAALLNEVNLNTGFTWTTVPGVNNGLPVLTEGADRPEESDTAEKVTGAINNLPELKDLTLDDQKKVENIRERYNNLPEDEKAKVSDEVLEKLAEAEERLTNLANPDWVAAEKVNEMFRALPDPEKVTLEDKPALIKACEALEALTEEQLKFFEYDLGVKMNELTWQIGALEAQAVVDSINALPEVEELTLASKADVEKAREQYEALEDWLKRDFNEEALKKLEAAEAKIEELIKDGEDASDKFDDEDTYLGVSTEARVYDDFENDIWLQFQQKEMNIGETAKFYPWRLEQPVTDVIHNNVARPNFNFKIVKGDSITLDTEKTNDWANVTAIKTGTTVVKVTYDAFDHPDGKHYDAISPVNTAYAVFTVNETGEIEPKVSDNLKSWRHYDTVYYDKGDTVPFTFTASADGADDLKVTLNGLEVKGNGNQYTVNLENRSNIIGVTAYKDGKKQSVYRVVDARFIKINVVNKNAEKENIEAGDTATVSFRGITMPVYKLATIYNPVFGANTTYVSYQNDTLGSFEGHCNQWDLATKNSFDVEFKDAGSYTFTSPKGIYCEWWGSVLGTDVTQLGSGVPNLNAQVKKDWFSSLPSFNVDVIEPKEPEKPEEDWEKILNGTLNNLKVNVSKPIVDSQKGEWAVLALARAGVIPEETKEAYLKNLREVLSGFEKGAVKLHQYKPTENERVILALSALGIDASNFEGYDLVSPLQNDVNWGSSQGNNSTIFAALALGSKPYGGARAYIDKLLETQGADGGWNISGSMPTDTDITAMAVQALAPYYETDEAVKTSVDNALAYLGTKIPSGNANTDAQVVTAYAALGRDAAEEEAGGLEDLLRFYNEETGYFRYGGADNQMATEQAAYALVAYQRYKNGANALYDMSDAFDGEEPTDPTPTPNPVNKDSLTALIKEAEGLREADYTSQSWSDFKDALEKAIAQRDSASATADTVKLAETLLKSKMDALQRKEESKSVTVSFTLVGDSKHGSPSSHTAFQTWIPKKTVTITGTSSATVWEIMQKAAEGTGVSYHNRGNYIDYITYNGVQLGEFDNGPNSGWMYTVNGSHPDLGVEQKLVVTGDDIRFHYTDDYTKEDTSWSHSHSWSSSWSHDAAAHWHECLASGCDITDNTKKNGYAAHTWDEGKKGEDGKVTYTCTVCGYTKTEDPENPDKPVDPENPDKPVEVKVPVVDTITIEGNKVTVTLKEELEGMDGYDFVIGNAKDCITTKDYAQVNKNVTGTKTSFYYVGKGKHCVYVHAYKRVNGKKVFSGWSRLRTFKVTAVTPAVPEIKSVKQSGSTVTVTYTKCKNATGYDVVLGSAVQKVHGEKRPVEYGKLVSKVTKGNVVKATFKNVKKGKYYVGLHAYNRTSEDNKKVFSPWSRTKTFTVKAAK